MGRGLKGPSDSGKPAFNDKEGSFPQTLNRDCGRFLGRRLHVGFSASRETDRIEFKLCFILDVPTPEVFQARRRSANSL
jgi:hypothetical protein